MSDRIAEALSESLGSRVPVLVFDSMQVYRELPVTTNQSRRREAELLGICSVADEWTVARHIEEAGRVLGSCGGPFVVDAGSGMYLNSLLLDIPLAPKVPPRLRERAVSLAGGVPNVRRESRRIELSLSGAPERGSIWEGKLRYETTLIYLRPTMETLEADIARRSRIIAREGLREVEALYSRYGSGVPPNASVRDSIGVRELRGVLEGEISQEEAEARIRTRTRKLARRQIRWFDKLVSTLRGRADTLTATGSRDADLIRFIDHLKRK